MNNEPTQYTGEEYVDPNTYMGPMRKSSPAKAAIAQAKPRDSQGRFLSGPELEAYAAQRQSEQFAAERAKMNAILGRGNGGQVFGQQVMQQPVQQQNNFQAILNANKPGSMNNDANRWDALLGRRKR